MPFFVYDERITISSALDEYKREKLGHWYPGLTDLALRLKLPSTVAS